MHPILFHLPSGTAISSYGFFMTLAALAGFFGTLAFARYRGLPLRPIAVTLVAMLIAAFVGGRLLNVLINFEAFREHPYRIADIGTSGFSLYGGIILSTFVGWILLRRYRVDTWTFADAGAPILGVSIALMRVGCYLNGCCFGKETDLPWGVSFPVLSQAHRHQLVSHPGDFFDVHPVHPTELYELAAALLLSAFAVFLGRKQAPSGTAFLSFATLFTLFRLGNSYLRIPPPSFDASAAFYPALYLSLSAVCIAFLIVRWQTSPPTAGIGPDRQNT